MDSFTEQLVAVIPASVSLLMLSKLSILLVLGWVVSLGFSRQAASVRHTIWFSLLLALLLVPVLHDLVPDLSLPVDAESRIFEFVIGSETGQIPEIPDYLRNIMIWTWCAITLVMLLHLLTGVVKVAGITRRATHVRNSHLTGQLEQLRQVAGIDRPVMLLQSRELDSPVSWGFLRPVILVPENADQWTSSTGRDVLSHELSHIERNDWLSLVIARITLSLYWFHPLVWWACLRLMEEAELACDDAVIIDENASIDYADTLLSLAREGSPQTFRHVAQAMAQSFLGRRISAILDKRVLRTHSESMFLVRAGLASLVLAALVSSLELTAVTPAQARNLYVYMVEEPPAQRVENLFVSGIVPVDTASRPDQALLQRLPAVPEMMTPLQLAQPDSGLQAIHEQDLRFIASAAGFDTPLTASADPVRILVQQQEPEYPGRALQRGIQGEVLASFTINPDGSLTDIKIVEASPAQIFERAVLEALAQYRFSRLPASAEQTVRRESRTQRFVFRLHD